MSGGGGGAGEEGGCNLLIVVFCNRVLSISIKSVPAGHFHIKLMTEAVARRCSVKFTENTCVNFIKKETLARVFFCEFCKISKNTFS